MSCPHHRQGRKAYVLLLVLVTLVLASLSLVQVASLSLRKNTQAMESLEALQMKWGRISCEQAVLPTADRVFENLDGNSSVRQKVILGGQIFELLLADEDAKANLNRIAAAKDTVVVEKVVRAVVPAATMSSIRIVPNSSGRLGGWGHVFDFRQLRRNTGNARIIAEATQDISIWGTGKLNIHRASDNAIRAVCSAVVPRGQADRIIETIHESAGTEVEIVLQRAIQNKNDRAKLRELLGNGSSTFSLWTELVSQSSRRSLCLAVRSVDETGRIVVSRFSLN